MVGMVSQAKISKMMVMKMKVRRRKPKGMMIKGRNGRKKKDRKKNPLKDSLLVVQFFCHGSVMDLGNALTLSLIVLYFLLLIFLRTKLLHIDLVLQLVLLY